jgi:hypothetical protein
MTALASRRLSFLVCCHRFSHSRSLLMTRLEEHPKKRRKKRKKEEKREKKKKKEKLREIKRNKEK